MSAIINPNKRGEKGEAGERGIQGLQGIQGERGEQGLKGDKGDVGANGTNGTAATITIGTVTTGNAGTNASVTNSGTSNAAVFNFTIPRGNTGATGISKRIEVITLTSNASGVVTATYSTPFASTPAVMLELLSTNNRNILRLTASSATGFTAVVEQRGQTLLSLLGLEILIAAVTAVNGATVRALVVEA